MVQCTHHHHLVRPHHWNDRMCRQRVGLSCPRDRQEVEEAFLDLPDQVPDGCRLHIVWCTRHLVPRETDPERGWGDDEEVGKGHLHAVHRRWSGLHFFIHLDYQSWIDRV